MTKAAVGNKQYQCIRYGRRSLHNKVLGVCKWTLTTCIAEGQIQERALFAACCRCVDKARIGWTPSTGWVRNSRIVARVEIREWLYQLRKLEQGVTLSKIAEGSSVHGRRVPITEGVFEFLCEIRDEAIVYGKVAKVFYGLNRVNENRNREADNKHHLCRKCAGWITSNKLSKRVESQRKPRGPRVAYQLQKLEQGIQLRRISDGPFVVGRTVPIMFRSTLVVETRCTYEHSRFQSLSPDQV